MTGITFNNWQEAKEYQSRMRKQGCLTKITKILGGYKVTLSGEASEWKNAPEVENVGDAIKDEDELP